ncbi:MAG: HDOD domain-containing protein [Nitrospiria bacterium]
MKSILFVDDEPMILEGLQNLLRRKRKKWEMVFALGGEKALEELKKAPFDVIVTDMRMPGIDGAALLKEVHLHHKKTVRIVLSGYSELEAALRAIPVAHQFLSKPCQPELLDSVIERACNLQDLISDEVLLKSIANIDNLPPVPRMYSALTNALMNPDTGAEDIAKILEQDMAMCAKLLQIVNSSFFASAMPTTNIKSAVTRLGFQMVKNLAMSLEVFKTKTTPNVPGFSVDRLQAHSLLVANLSTNLPTQKQLSEDTYMAAMLHDIGQLIMATELPDKLKKAIETANKETIPLHAAEEKLYGVTHAEIGAYLLGMWGLPYPVVEAVANHHDPGRVSQHDFAPLSAVHIADGLISEAEENLEAPPYLDLDYLESMGVMNQLESWRKMVPKLMTIDQGGTS